MGESPACVSHIPVPTRQVRGDNLLQKVVTPQLQGVRTVTCRGWILAYDFISAPAMEVPCHLPTSFRMRINVAVPG
jgi:hypothetical protein